MPRRKFVRKTPSVSILRFGHKPQGSEAIAHAHEREPSLHSATTMNLRFLSTSILNSKVADTASGEVLYNIVTKGISGSSSDIRLRTVIRNAKDEVVAVWERMHGSQRGDDWITYHSESSDGILSDWLPQLALFPLKAQTFTAPNKQEFLWQRRKTKKGFQLIDVQTKNVLAKSHRLSGFALRATQPGVSLIVQSEVESILDAVVLSFVIVEQLRWEEEVTPVNSADGVDTLLINLGATVKNMFSKPAPPPIAS
ncbi:hypothetical protein C8Q80DRAFT_471172 [Daedaleopsis nitida]|nr:hypothetical protein C8Q80DRAFT_471172 [Daedaleopsis nitida]